MVGKEEKKKEGKRKEGRRKKEKRNIGNSQRMKTNTKTKDNFFSYLERELAAKRQRLRTEF